MSQPSVTVVLPVHDERGNVEAVVDDLTGALSERWPDHELLAVDDGSTDGSGPLLDSLAAEVPGLRVVHHEHNRGYGGAVHSGIQAAHGALLAIMDADGQFRSPDLVQLLELMEGGSFDCVLGYRADRADNPYRRGLASIAHVVSTRLLGMDVRDINCALKVFRTEDVQALDLRSRAGFVNTEILLGLDVRDLQVEQIPVHHYPRTSGTPSGGRISVILRSAKEAATVGVPAFRRRRRSRAAIR